MRRAISGTLGFKIAAVAISAALGLVIAEIVMRTLSPVQVVIFPEGLIAPSADPAVCYELNPRWPEHDRDGLRVSGPQTGKGPHGKKILVTGDSIAYGLGVGPGQTISATMGRILKGCGLTDDWEALNLGVPGHGIGQICARLENKGAKYEADYLAYIYCLNDIFDDAGQAGNFLIANNDKLILPEQMLETKYIDLLLRLQMAQRGVLLYRKLKYGKAVKTGVQADFTYLKNRTDDTALKIINGFLSRQYKHHYVDVNWGNAEHSYYPDYYNKLYYLLKLNAGLSGIGRFCRKSKISPYIFIVPIFTPDKTDSYVFAHIHGLITALSRHHGLYVKDLQPLLSAHPSSLVSQKDYSHPSAYGNEVIAREVLKTIGFSRCLAGNRMKPTGA